MRTPNISQRGKHHCRYCPDDGWVVVDRGNEPQTEEQWESLRKLRRDNPKLVILIYGEAVAPCPYCEQGYENEFPGKDASKRDWLPFGAEGWWRGREDLKATLVPLNANPELSPGENARRVRELQERIGRVL